ncbi:MAG: hypothetical protein GY940_35345 [bacterium]|nr:hypothetical protein [bacterium]
MTHDLKALCPVTRRHESLRTYFLMVGENSVQPVHDGVPFLLDRVKPGPDAPGYVRAATPARNALPSALHASHKSRNALPLPAGAGAPTLHASHKSRNALPLSAGAGAPALHASHKSRNALPPALTAGAPTLHAFPSATNAGTEYMHEASRISSLFTITGREPVRECGVVDIEVTK